MSREVISNITERTFYKALSPLAKMEVGIASLAQAANHSEDSSRQRMFLDALSRRTDDYLSCLHPVSTIN